MWCLFYRVGRVDPALGQVDGLDQRGSLRAWIHAWDSLLPFLLWNSSRTVKRAAHHIWVPSAEFAHGQLLEPFSSCYCIQVGSQEEGAEEGTFLSTEEPFAVLFLYSKSQLLDTGKQDDWVISRIWSAPCKVKLDFCPFFCVWLCICQYN